MTDLSTLDMNGLGDDADLAATARVVFGNGAPAGPDTGFRVDADHALGRRVGASAPASAVVDTEWEEYQEYKRWKAAKALNGGNLEEAIRHSNTAIGLRKTERITVDETPDMPPTGYVVGVNGTVYVLRPGEPMDCPLPVLEVIKNAITSAPKIDNLTKRVIGYTDRPRIPWRYA